MSGNKVLMRFWVAGSCLSFASGCLVEERRFDEAYARQVAGEEETETSTDDVTDASGDTDPVEETDTGSGDSDECVEYCDRVMSNCTDEFAVYASEEACLAVCALLPLAGDDTNTVECRSEQARLAGSTGEPNVHCPAAGPGGSTPRGAEGCGTNCESYCYLQPLACGDTTELVLEANECLRRCRALPDEGNFDVALHHDGDNVQCRLVHVSSAALGPSAAETHCWHASITPRPDSPCGPLPETTPNCEHYCDVATTACVEEQAVYDDVDQCLAACEVMELGEVTDTEEDTVGCRTYHAYAALEAPDTHCTHTSPAGDGHCGEDNCETYCKLAAALCETQFAENFEGEDACLAACEDLDGAAADSGYDIDSASSGDTVACRIYHAVLSSSDEAACDAAFGAAPCD